MFSERRRARHLSECRLIFCINSGRAGSNYLARVLDSTPQVYAYHEPDPQMIGPDLNLINEYDYPESLARRRRKADRIADSLLRLPRRSVYCETSHMFIKTFHDVVIKRFPGQVEVIMLRRYLPSVLKSFLELGYFSTANSHWPLWMSSPNAATGAIPCIDVDANLDPCDRAIAYLIDIEARYERFRNDYSDIKIHEVRLETLSNPAGLTCFLADLGVEPGRRTNEVCRERTNQRSDRKRRFSGGQTYDLAWCRERIVDYLKRATNAGIGIPKTLVLSQDPP